MSSDIDNIFEAAKKSPKDPLTIQALADAFEELGAPVESVRALTIDGPTVLVFGLTGDMNSEGTLREVRRISDRVVEFLELHTGHKVTWIHVPDNLTIRAIKAQAKEKT